ncbi:hypothetical protein DSO57_1020202 [Entomophthora muscae]|uniref:Uncharacterized protein n=2 Tax=Entomophthora muscae TaxID=34485 RepID=A0ACC2SH28_9FUNG|nr:hypothetical protein DSO57_1029912 [Entomophthora muscae]KAJ9061487.1 hypothetical protein DSO57_1020202 [Entomophthora muscae]
MSKLHTPLYASHPSGRRSISHHHHTVESVLPEELVGLIRTTQFDEMLASGFTLSASHSSTTPNSGCSISTLKLTLTPSNARGISFLKRFSLLQY